MVALVSYGIVDIVGYVSYGIVGVRRVYGMMQFPSLSPFSAS